MKFIGSFFILITLLIANAFATDPSATAQGGDVIAKVGNHQITREMLDNIINTIPEENRVPFLTPDGRKKILDEVVSSMLFAEAAKAEGIDKDAAVKTRLNYAQTEYLGGEDLPTTACKESSPVRARSSGLLRRAQIRVYSA